MSYGVQRSAGNWKKLFWWMLTPNMTPRGSLQLSYLIVGKFLVSQTFQQGAIWPLPIFDHNSIDFCPSIWSQLCRFSDLKIFPFDFWLKIGLMCQISLKYHRPAVSHRRAAMSFLKSGIFALQNVHAIASQPAWCFLNFSVIVGLPFRSCKPSKYLVGVACRMKWLSRMGKTHAF
jgi:hypothetical protein